MSRLTAPATDANAKVARGTIRPREAAEQEAVVSRLSVLHAKPTLLDFNLIEKGISERTTADTSRGAAFVRYVLATVFDLHSDDLDQHIVDGGQDRGIDIVYIDYENRVVNLGSCRTVAHFRNSHRTFPGEEIDKIVSIVDDILFRREEVLDQVNGALAAKIREIWAFFDKGRPKIVVRLFSNQLPLCSR